MDTHKSQPDRAVVFLVSALICGLHAALFLPLLRNDAGLMGEDHALVLPNLLAGYYAWHVNGLFSLPWFTPAFCGGVPFYADPEIGYFSIAQLFTLFVDPVRAVGLTLVALTVLGYIGTYVLLSSGFGVGRWAAVVGAALFAFNGFVPYRMMIGHVGLTYFALVPLLAACLTDSPGWRSVKPGRELVIIRTLLAALLVTVLLQAGATVILVPALLAVLPVLLVHGLLFGFELRPYVRFFIAVLAGLCLSATKVAAELAFLRQFPRDYLPLPGYDSLVHAVMIVFQALFVGPPMADHAAWTRNAVIVLQRHELEFCVSLVPLLLIVAAAALRLRRGLPRLRLQQWMLGVALGFLLLMPVFLNWYQPSWNHLLKQLPIIGNSSTLMRWLCIYIPVLSVLAALAMQRLPWSQLATAAAALAGLLASSAAADHGFYRHQPYDPRAIVEAYAAVKAGQRAPGINNISLVVDDNNRPAFSADRNNGIAVNSSQIACYQPMFGYGLERFPLGTLHPGAVFDSVDGRHLNLKNPACYVYPHENGCSPGEQFTLAERSEAEAFTAYRPISFAVPAIQKLANAINLAAWGGALGCAAWCVFSWNRRRWLGAMAVADQSSP